MKIYIYAIVFISALCAHATEPQVTLISFKYAGSKTRAAEICGKVTDVSHFPTFVKIIVDEKVNPLARPKGRGFGHLACWLSLLPNVSFDHFFLSNPNCLGKIAIRPKTISPEKFFQL